MGDPIFVLGVLLEFEKGETETGRNLIGKNTLF